MKQGWKAVVAEVCDKHKVLPRELISPLKHNYLMPARREAMYRMRVELGMSYPAIGRRMLRDHCTVVYNVRRYQGMSSSEWRKGWAK